MSSKDKKGKKKGKGKRTTDASKLSAVDRTFCELTITDLNQKLARLRAHLLTLDDTNINITEKLRSLEEDRLDVAAHLERTLAERNNTIEELEERLIEITKVREQENTDAQNKILDLEAKYKAMHDQLASEIKLLNGKLNSLDEFRVQRDVLLAKFDDQDEEQKQNERAHLELIQSMEQKAVVEKDALKKEVEVKLLQVSEDFTRSSEIRNAGYTRRLIRENIALQKEIHTLMLSQLKIQEVYDEQTRRHSEMTRQYYALEETKNQLIRNAQHKIEIIDKLTSTYEKLKTKYVETLKYRKMYEAMMKQNVCENFTYNDMSKKMRILGKRIEQLKVDKNQMYTLHETHETEILHLRDIIGKIKTTVKNAITVFENKKQKMELGGAISEDTFAAQATGRRDLMLELINILSTHDDKMPSTPSVSTISRMSSTMYRPGNAGMVPKDQASLMEIFKREARKVASAEMISPEYQLKQEDTKIIPQPWPVDLNSLVDVELGSTLYVSSSREEQELAEADEEPLEGEEASSSDYQSTQLTARTAETETGKAASIISVKESGMSIALEQTEGATDTDTVATVAPLDDDEDENSINFFY